jgi:hypothetical protein
MATLEEAIVKRMNATVGLTALVGARIYPGSVPEDAALPAIAFQKTTNQSILTHSGPTGWANSTVQFIVSAEDYAGKKRVAEQIRVCWDGYHGTIVFSTTDSLTVGMSRIEDRSDIDEAQVGAFLGERVDVFFIHQEE